MRSTPSTAPAKSTQALENKEENKFDITAISTQINRLLDSGSPLATPAIEKLLVKFDPKRLWELTKINPRVKEFCQRPAFQGLLTQNENYKNLPLFVEESTIVSMDKKIKISLFERLVGYYLFVEYKKNKNDMLLNEACKLGSFQALNERINIKLKGLSEAKNETLATLKEKITQDILPDIHKMVNLYRGSGYLCGGAHLLMAANLYHDQPDARPSEERYLLLSSPPPEQPFSFELLEASMLFFNLAHALEKQSLSEKIGRSYIREEEQKLGSTAKYFTTWEQGVKYIESQILPIFFRASGTSSFFTHVQLLTQQEQEKYPEEYEHLSTSSPT